MIRKISSAFLTVLLLFLLAAPVLAQNDSQVEVYFFWSNDCPHCAQEEVFLDKLVKKYPRIVLKSFETSQNQDNFNLSQKFRKDLGIKKPWVPLTVVNDHYVIGFRDEETTGQQIETMIKDAIEGNTGRSSLDNVPESISLPVFGSVKLQSLSLPALSVVLGLLDGFNPCAMWTLLFLISLLLGMKDRKRMWILGTAFIVSSAFVYFLIMAAWLNFFLVLGFVAWIRVLIALVALTAGGYNLREYWINKNGGCKVTGNEKRRRIFERIRKITEKEQFILALGGIILLAFAVNIVELLCSAGLPAVFTQVLVINDLSRWRYYFYILLYILFFMIDDLFVFFAAMITLKMVGIETKYARFSKLIGGALMIVIGLLMFFKPEWLMLK
ncbi:hypothetical protein KKD61_05000 [Patescibacteria group bacterium]|nr:hypothetical protein [Patescibacteria group bacterium]